MNTKLELAFFILTGIAIILGTVWIVATEKRLKRFFLGKKAKDLEETLMNLENHITELHRAKDATERDLIVIHTQLRKSIRGLETIRFNPFPDQGSNQSFAVGLLNEEGDGVVFSSLYSRLAISGLGSTRARRTPRNLWFLRAGT